MSRVWLRSFLLTLLIIVGTASAQITLELPSYQANEPGFGDWWRLQISQFEEAHPGVTVDLIAQPFEAHHQQLVTRFAAQNPPALVHISARFFYQYADRGWLAPLGAKLAQTEVPEKWTALQELMEWNGETYGLLLLGYAYGLYYNQCMFEEAGVAVPTTVAELNSAANELTVDQDGDARTDQYGLAMFIQEGSTSTYMMGTWFLLGSGTHWTSDAGELQLTSPAVVAAVEDWRAIAKSGATPLGLADFDARQHIMAGNSAMLIDGSWVTAMIPSAAEGVSNCISVARPPFEVMPSGPSNVIGVAAGLSAEQEELAWAFIEQLTSQESQEAYAMLTGSPSPRSGAVPAELEADAKFLTFVSAMDEATAASSRFIPPGYETAYSEFADIVTRGLVRLATTDLATESVLEEMQRELAQIEAP